MLSASSAAATGVLVSSVSFAEPATAPPQTAHQYEIFELTLEGPSTGNPYVDQHLEAVFTLGSRSVNVEGFYDGSTTYKIRFMPDTPGDWSYTATSSFASPQKGAVACQPARAGVHGPIRVANQHHFAHADGTPYHPFGTTCYAWTHQGDALELQTLASLKTGPFNKIRMCIFPKSYQYNRAEPVYYPFQRPAGTPLTAPGDITRFDPAFWKHLEERIAQLRDLNIEADLILFHPYDRWGFASMPHEADERYLRYLIARLSAYSNVWWSLANEFDLMRAKTTADFTRLLHLTQQYDPYQHMRSIHYSRYMYDYASPAVTHASIQTYDFASAPAWLAAWKKPIVYDEIQYEGNIFSRWGNLSPDEMTRRFWLGVINGCYVTHGETFIDPKLSAEEAETQKLWWSHGGTLKGASPARIAFLRKVLETTTPLGLEPPENPYYLNAVSRVLPSPPNSVTYTPSDPPAAILYYLDFHQPERVNIVFSPNTTYTAELIDPWNMTITPIPGTFSGRANIKLAVKPYQALRLKRIMKS